MIGPGAFGSRRRFSITLFLVVACAVAAQASSVVLSPPLVDGAGAPLPPGISIQGMPAGDAAGARTFELDPVAEIYPTMYQAIAFGDTDHDGKNETILYVNDNSTFHYRILEEQGNNVYTDEYSGAQLLPYATADLDRDGKSDLVGQYGFKVQVFESADATSYPTRLVWQSQDIMNVVGYTAIGDTDRDGRMEIIHSLNPFSGNSELFIFENTGNDTYAQVYHTVVGYGANGPKVIADFDGDGLTEIVFAGLSGQIYVYRSPSDNVWERVWTSSTGLSNAYGCVGGTDTDGDGKPEFFIMGNGPLGWTTIVYEATGVGQFAPVATFAMNDGYIGMSTNALGNLDGIGPDEYLMHGGGEFWIYRPTAPGSWEMIGNVVDPERRHFGVQAYDVNRNGKAEVFWDMDSYIQSGFHTIVLENPTNPASAGGTPSGIRAAALRVYPNPCMLGSAIRIFPGDPARISAISILDASGRLVDRIPASGEPITWKTRTAAPGVYVFRAEDDRGKTIATRRAILIR